MTRYTVPIILAGSLIAAAGCGSGSDKQTPSNAPPAAKSSAPVTPYGTYVRTLTKADLARTAKLRDEAGPNQGTPPTGPVTLVIAKGAGQDVLKAGDHTLMVAMDMYAKDGKLFLTTYVNPAQATFCGPQVAEGATYSYSSVGGKLVLKPTVQDQCADRDATLTGTWAKG